MRIRLGICGGPPAARALPWTCEGSSTLSTPVSRSGLDGFLGVARACGLAAHVELRVRPLIGRATGGDAPVRFCTRALPRLPCGRLASRHLVFTCIVVRGGPLLRRGTGSCGDKPSQSPDGDSAPKGRAFWGYFSKEARTVPAAADVPEWESAAPRQEGPWSNGPPPRGAFCGNLQPARTTLLGQGKSRGGRCPQCKLSCPLWPSLLLSRDRERRCLGTRKKISRSEQEVASERGRSCLGTWKKISRSEQEVASEKTSPKECSK